jgi:hypothetical protein
VINHTTLLSQSGEYLHIQEYHLVLSMIMMLFMMNHENLQICYSQSLESCLDDWEFFVCLTNMLDLRVMLNPRVS